MLIHKLEYYVSSIFTLLFSISNWPTVIAAFVGLPISRPFRIQLRRTGLLFNVRDRMDVWIIKETCIDRDYERMSGPIQDGWNVMDIGAGLGDFTICAARQTPHGHVHAYEPFPNSVKMLEQNIGLNQISNVTTFAEAVSGEAGTLQLEMSGAAVQHHTVRSGQAQTIQVPAITLSTALARLNGSRCDLLKMDCEGAEYDILMKAEANCWKCIRQIVMEYHDGVTPFSHHDLIAFFEQRGFKVRCWPSQVHAHLGFLHIALGS